LPAVRRGIRIRRYCFVERHRIVCNGSNGVGSGESTCRSECRSLCASHYSHPCSSATRAGCEDRKRSPGVEFLRHIRYFRLYAWRENAIYQGRYPSCHKMPAYGRYIFTGDFFECGTFCVRTQRIR